MNFFSSIWHVVQVWSQPFWTLCICEYMEKTGKNRSSGPFIKLEPANHATCVLAYKNAKTIPPVWRWNIHIVNYSHQNEEAKWKWMNIGRTIRDEKIHSSSWNVEIKWILFSRLWKTRTEKLPPQSTNYTARNFQLQPTRLKSVWHLTDFSIWSNFWRNKKWIERQRQFLTSESFRVNCELVIKMFSFDECPRLSNLATFSIY